jgi:hypothetical protein
MELACQIFTVFGECSFHAFISPSHLPQKEALRHRVNDLDTFKPLQPPQRGGFATSGGCFFCVFKALCLKNIESSRLRGYACKNIYYLRIVYFVLFKF